MAGVVIVGFSGRRRMIAGRGVSMIVMSMIVMGRSRMGVIVMHRDGRMVVVGVHGRRGMIVMSVVVMGSFGGRGGMPVILMTVDGGRRRMPVVVRTMIDLGGPVAMSIVPMGLGDRVRGMVIMTVSGIVAMARVVAVIVVRLVLVAHCDSVPLPLFAVFAAKSV